MLRVAMKMLLGDRAKYVGLLFGITFTSFLVTFAGSYFCGFMTRGFALIAENPGADVWVMDPAVESTELITNIPDSNLARVRSVDGVDVDVRAETICVHGDTPGAVEFARALRSRLQREGVEVRSPQACD